MPPSEIPRTSIDLESASVLITKSLQRDVLSPVYTPKPSIYIVIDVGSVHVTLYRDTGHDIEV